MTQIQPSRRSILRAAGAAAFGQIALASGPDGGELSLAAAAARTGRFFGAAVRLKQLQTEGDLKAAVLRDCSMVIPEVAMQWAAIEPYRGQPSFYAMDGIARFASTHQLKLLGHALLWHLSVPAWASELMSRTKDWSVVRQHFASVMPRYRDVIKYWNVVNEPIEGGSRMDGLRDSIFLNVFGPDYIDRALRDARMLAPAGMLMINEYGLDYNIPVERDRRYLLLKLIERLMRAGVPLDGLGIQAHLDLSKSPFSEAVFEEFLRDVAGFGLKIVITELDVKEYDYVAPVGIRDERVADLAHRYLDVALTQPAVIGVCTWGLSDRQSWLKVLPDDLARYPGAWPDGTGPGLNRGLPYDASMHRKPMYRAIMAAFMSASDQRTSKRWNKTKSAP